MVKNTYIEGSCVIRLYSGAILVTVLKNHGKSIHHGTPNIENPKSVKIPPPPTRKCLHWERFSPPSRFCSSWAPGRGSLLQNYRNYVRLVAPETIHITVSFYALKWTLLPGIFRELSTLLPLNIVRIWGLVKIFSIHFLRS